MIDKIAARPRSDGKGEGKSLLLDRAIRECTHDASNTALSARHYPYTSLRRLFTTIVHEGYLMDCCVVPVP